MARGVPYPVREGALPAGPRRGDQPLSVQAVRERHIRVARTGRYHTLGEAGANLREVWFVCHGYRQLGRRFLPRFAELDDGTRRIGAPEALSRFYLHDPETGHGKDVPIGATWMTREDRENEIDPAFYGHA